MTREWGKPTPESPVCSFAEADYVYRQKIREQAIDEAVRRVADSLRSYAQYVQRILDQRRGDAGLPSRLETDAMRD